MLRTPMSIAAPSSAVVLPTPVKTIRETAERAQPARDRQRRVRLERVMDRVRVAGERLVNGAVAFVDGSGAVNVERRAMGRRERLERDAVAHQHGALSLDSGQSV